MNAFEAAAGGTEPGALNRRRLVRVAAGAAVGGASLALLSACGAAPSTNKSSTSGTTSTSSTSTTGTTSSSSASSASSTSSTSSASSTSSSTSSAGSTNGWVAKTSNPLKAMSAVQATGTVNINGTLDSTWSAVTTPLVISALNGTVQAVGSLFSTKPPLVQSKVYLQWDTNNLYVLEERTNTSAGLPITDRHIGVQMYLGNSLGVFVSNAALTTAPNASGQYTTNGYYTVWGTPRGPSGDHNPHIWLRAGDNGQQSNTHPTWPIKATINSTGYVMSMAIPWSALQAIPWKVEQGARLRFTLLATAVSPVSHTTAWGQIMYIGDGDLVKSWGVLTLA